MRLVAIAFPLAIGLGYVFGGRLRHLGDLRFRFAWAGLAGVGLQFVPAEGRAGFLILLASFGLLVVAAVANRRLPGFPLVIAGLCLNLVVIGVNEGMPVTRDAVVASDQADTLDDFADTGGAKHHLATDDDDLLFLADTIGIPSPVRQAISVGDIAAYAGAMWFVVAGMLRRGEPAGRDAPAAEAPV